MKRVLLSLWLGGAAVYAASTLLWTNTVIMGGKTASTSVVTGIGPKPAANAPRIEPKAEKPIAPPGGQPGIIEEGQAAKAKPPAEAMPPEEAGQAEETASGVSAVQGQGELLRVVTAASIRSLPSSSADVIGSAQVGAELRARSHESGWVQFVDPESGHSGWIDSVFLEPVTQTTDQTAEKTKPATAPPAQDQSVADEATDAPPPEDQQPKAVAEDKSVAEDEPKPPAPVRAPDSASAEPPKHKPRAKEQAPIEQASKERASKKQTADARASKQPAPKKQAGAEQREQPVEQQAGPPPPSPAEQEELSPYRKYVELPAGEELLPPKRRFGLFGRRRMMMPDVPPDLPEEFPEPRGRW